MSTGAAATAAATAGRRSSGGSRRRSSSATSATQAATSPARLKTTETVGVAPPLSCAMHAVLSLHQQWQGRPVRADQWRMQAASWQGAGKAVGGGSKAWAPPSAPHPRDFQCCSSACPARSSPTADTSSGSASCPPLAPTVLSSRPNASATLRATPPADWVTRPGTDPPRSTSAGPLGWACGGRARQV